MIIIHLAPLPSTSLPKKHAHVKTLSIIFFIPVTRNLTATELRLHDPLTILKHISLFLDKRFTTDKRAVYPVPRPPQEPNQHVATHPTIHHDACE
ncbi:hypothetical protein BVX99_00910 [bacterium F16]|nr:hypothetical protein BVX99_00910 [bacterium F16]